MKIQILLEKYNNKEPLTTEELAQVRAYLTIQNQIEQVLASNDKLQKEIAELLVKDDKNLLSIDEKRLLLSKQKQLESNIENIYSSVSIDPEVAKELLDDFRKSKLDRLKANKGTLNFANPDDLFEFVLRTQSLNPYSRERRCDINFIQLLSVISKDLGKSKETINRLTTAVKNAILNN